MTFEQRVQELLDFERESGVPLPMFPWQIIDLEDKGFTVDLETGTVYREVTVQPTASAKAILHLLAGVAGELTI